MNLSTARTFLFVPGDRPDRFGKAAASGADVVVLDLEDAVAPDRKPEARRHLRAWLREGGAAVVRVNAPGTPWHDDDLAMAAEAAAAVMVPKAEDPAALAAIARRVPAIVPLVETAAGVLGAPAVCAAPSVVRPAFGSVDLGAQLGVDHRSHDALRHARATLVLAAAAAGCAAPIDGVTTALDDPAALRADTEHAAMLGFTAKLCVHPRQVDVVHDAFAPSEEDVAWARRVVAAAGDGAAVAHGGEMIDRPVLLRAQAVLARAAR
ncbi:CoA ester lyase [Amycolatopsis sp. OK19-0408]|uniref:CoA ester lyase n=1 Tax=Amycolatopsis iheyensis TaxID=2945988 RepID=A0A9X2SJM8_9PSEU|nr:CoA ester lyase [Amycolatopsis iheyensis]MCR6484912.1 CoA ester lyase [Amycolatopsis iheyensis]